MNDSITINNPVALITGGAKRIGAAIARALHQQDYNIVLHYRNSQTEASDLANELNQVRSNSCALAKADLANMAELGHLAQLSLQHWGRLDVLINNASSFYPTPVAEATEQQWDDIMASNLKAPFFLAQMLAPALQKSRGCIINMADIYAEKPLKQHSLYSIAKAANAMLTKTLAQELAPHIRVNGVAPGAILWPEQEALTETAKQTLLQKIPLQATGNPSDIAETIVFLVQHAPYINGQIIAVDGGRNLTI